MLRYKIGEDCHLLIEEGVRAHLEQHRQIDSTSVERGGQLFARLEPNRVILVRATGPRTSDEKRRFFFRPNRKKEQEEINTLFDQGLHYVGDWHTHPEPIAHPSQLDLRTMADCFARSKHTLNHFLLLIVGQATPPEGLWVGLCNERDVAQLPFLGLH